MKAVEEYWKLNPELRLGQLLYKIASQQSPSRCDPFYLDDQQLRETCDNLRHNTVETGA